MGTASKRPKNEVLRCSAGTQAEFLSAKGCDWGVAVALGRPRGKARGAGPS